MTNERFWELVDNYENLDKDGNPFVATCEVKYLSEDIIKYNKGNIEESKADFNMFNFENKEEANKIFDSILKEAN